ncbi:MULTISPECIES: YtxH domain-containing protein [Clostridium]|jgi:gas vesicle protein|uniref:YtxH domain-containing protein n=1 Tax=Clostridium lapidicellarium TaxID=3240931 RepID=A0ABV4DZU3_9CLOT|nr:YtxH domain-containing protein [uncultured Clostridium sp.]NLU08419.1 YtxH domain-containing protein [Clostridiales bacterium]
MRGKFIAGAIIGAAVGMMVMPELRMSNRRKMKRASRRLKDTADDMMDWMK